MKILILGAAGNLGSQLKTAFSNIKDIEAIGWDQNEINLLDGASIEEKIAALKPEIIINAAAYNAVDKCESDEAEFALAKKLNEEAVGALAEIAAKIGAIFIQYSTDYVFGGQNQLNYDENAEPDPLNKYGLSKFLGEKKILAQKNLKYYLIRTSKLFGPKGQSAFAKPSFFDLMLKLAAEKKVLEIVDEEKSFFTYTPDLAAATKKLIIDKKPFGIYHLTNSGAATWYEAAGELFKISNLKPKIIPVSGEKFPRPARRPKSSLLINTKLPPLRNYTEALKEYLQKITF